MFPALTNEDAAFLESIADRLVNVHNEARGDGHNRKLRALARKIRENIKDCEYLKMKAEEHRREAEAVNLERRRQAGIYDEPGY